MQRVISCAIAALFITLSAASVAGAATADDAIKYRHAVMEEMASHMSALTLILFDKVDGAAAYAQGHADALARASAELEILFPEVSRDGDTHALPVIWDNPDKFSAAVAKAKSKSADLQAAIGGDDRQATLAAMAAAGKACKACHEAYRAEEDDSDSHSH